MVDVVLILTSVIFAILIIIAAIYFLVYFQHPEDKWVAWLPKVVVVLALSISAYNIYLLPLDVALQKGQFSTGAAAFMPKLTVSLYTITSIVSMVVVPFIIFWYEGIDDEDDPDAKSGSIGPQIAFAMKWTIPIMVVLFGGVGALWHFFGYANIPVAKFASYSYPRADYYVFNYCNVSATPWSSGCMYYAPGAPTTSSADYNTVVTTMQVQVNYVVYLIAIVSLLGYILFAVFGGVGMFALPLDLIQGFFHRPRPISNEEYDEKKKVIGQQAQILMEIGKQIQDELKGRRAEPSGRFGQNSAKRKLQRKEAEFRKDVLILEIFHRKLEDAHKNQGGNFLIHLGKLLGGILGAVLSLFWVLHILVYTFENGVILQTAVGSSINPPLGGFLNDFFINVSPVPAIGIFFYSLFSFYLLFCVVKGLAKLGMRLVFMTLHPLVIGETMMNSIVFNAGVILISSLAVANFCTNSFSDYAKYTASQSVFGVQISYLQGLGYVIDAMSYVLIGFFLLSVIYNLYNPYKKQRENRMNFKW